MKLLAIMLLLLSQMVLFSNAEENKEVELEINVDLSDLKFDPIPPDDQISKDIKGWVQEFEYISLVLYNYSVDSKRSLFQDGKFHKGVKGQFSKKLTENEATVVVNAITGKHLWKGGALCYMPHHGFVFYNKKDEVVGHIEICFMCGRHKSFPSKGLSLYWDLDSMRKLIKSKGIPVYDTTKEWENYFKKLQSHNVQNSKLER